jgi:hypothetical protein
MKTNKQKLFISLSILVVTTIHAYYNVALSTTAGGHATVTSSTPSASGYEADWAIDGVITFCNNATSCPGPYVNKMFQSNDATTSIDVFFLINMGGMKNIISLYLSLEESNPT